MSSLPGAIDLLIKKRFDDARETGTIDELKEISSEYRLYSNQANLNKWRNWRSGLTYVSPKGLTLSGAIDDLLVTSDGKWDEGTKPVAPFDVKTKGKAPTLEYCEQYYQNQMDCYALLLEKNKMKTTGEAILLYYYPAGIAHGKIDMASMIIRMKTDPNRAAKKCLEIIELLSTDKIPEPNPACDYCNMLEQSRGI
jgi:hypothetical protein